MKKKVLFTSMIACLMLLPYTIVAQTGTTFWFAAPEVTSGHVTDNPIVMRLATSDLAATVTISLPANGAFTPIIINLLANSSHTEDLSAYINDIETKPANTILTTGILVEATAPISAYYEVNTGFNPEIFALKGENALGTEFYVPFQTFWNNGSYTPTPYTSFDIVATEDNTTVYTYPKKDIVGHAAQTAFIITLDQGETYSAAGVNSVGADNASGSVVVSDKPIAITIKDDSNTNGGCRDLIGDQIVPVNIVGKEYIVVKGSVADERIFIIPTENNTQVSINGVYQTTLFAGETYTYDITSSDLTYVTTSKPAYLLHVSGFGCEMGGAILPPLNCAGSEQISFVRSSSEYFGLNLLVKSGSEGDFEVNGDPSLITAGDFSPVPGTGGDWVAAQVSFNTSEISVGTANLITNDSEIFSMGIINGGASSGCRYGYFSEFVAEIIVEAGPNQIICANKTATLNGSVTGGTTEGIWSTNGSGTFTPDEYTLNATYTPSFTDITNGSVTLTLTSNSICFPEQDQMTITFTPAPGVDAGADIISCKNNPNVALNGNITIATGGVWSGGSGTFIPDNTTLNANYIPTSTEIASGSLALTLTSTGNGSCDPESDIVNITFNDSPIVDAGPNVTGCVNNPTVALSGAVSNTGGGVWTGGAGVFNPNNSALNAFYTPTDAEIAGGGVTLYLTSTNNGNCNAEIDSVSVIINPAPVVDAGADQIACGNNPEVTLAGSVLNASGGTWSGGGGTFTPDNATLNATYTPTAAEVIAGNVTLTLTSTGNGSCFAENDFVTITFTNSPQVNAGLDQSICANNPELTLDGSVAIATGGVWSGGLGTFTPDNATLNATYTPTASEIALGSITLTLTSTGNGDCNAESDEMLITVIPEPTVNAGVDQTVCVDDLNIALTGAVSGITNTGIWSSSGTGSFVPNNTTLNATYVASSADSINGSVSLTLTSTNNGNCLAVDDQMQVTILPAGIANAGGNKTVCANNATVTLSGSVSGGATAGTWTTSGTGVFSPNNTTLNANYIPSDFDKATGTITLALTANSCNLAQDELDITIMPAPVVDAGDDETICVSDPNVNLNGSVTAGALTGIWTTTGSGTFSPNSTTLNATYQVSAADVSAQQIKLILTSTGNGNCIAVRDTMQVNILPVGTANAGQDQVVCANNADVSLSGSVSGASSGVWTSTGTGTFVPNDTALNATYIPSSGDKVSGNVNLVLTANSCNVATDFMTVTITPAPDVEAGNDVTVCANNSNVSLNGTISNAGGGLWTTTGDGIFAPSNTDLNATYVPGINDKSSGMLRLYLTSTGNGNCFAVKDSLEIEITPAPIVNAGADQQVCNTSTEAQLLGQVSGGTNTGQWTTSGTGIFIPDQFALNAVYQFSAADKANGSVILTLTSTNNGLCNVENDQLTISFGSSVFVDAGVDQTVCSNNADIILNGLVSGGSTTGQWSSSGTGSFSPNNTTLNATYTPSAADIANGMVSIYLISTNNGGCQAGKDTLDVVIDLLPTVDAGSDHLICYSTSSVSLLGTLTNSATGVWSTNGTGSFIPNNSELSTAYVLSEADKAAGLVKIALTSTDNGSCSDVSDTLLINIVTPVSANFGFNNDCENSTISFNDNSISSHGSIVGWEWNFGDGSSSSDQNPFHQYRLDGNFNVTLIAESDLGCKDTITKTITIYPLPEASFTVEAFTFNLGDTIRFNDLSNGTTNWSWDFGDNSGTSTRTSPSYSYEFAGAYTVTQTVTNEFNCSDTAVVDITISPIEDVIYAPKVPTGFSPNGDQKNDVLLVKGGPFFYVDFRIYNQWGELLFQSNDPEIGWDGTYKNKKQPLGVYVYTLRATTEDDKTYVKTGEVKMIR